MPILQRKVRIGATALLLALLGLKAEAAKKDTSQDTHQFETAQQSVTSNGAKGDLPPDIARSCDELFQIGMADPRAGEYRAIELTLSSRDDGKTITKTVQTYGWVLPAQPRDENRYAVCWNGLVYPVANVGTTANPAIQIRALLVAPDRWGHDPMRPRQDEAVASDKLNVLKIPLLLRLGESDLAYQVWNQWKAFPGQNLYNEPSAPPNFFVVAAREWIWEKFLRGREAHMRGDPKAAVEGLKDIPSAQRKIEEFATKEGIRRLTSGQSQPYQPTDLTLDLGFLVQVPRLLADDERRVSENITSRNEEYEPGATADKKQRIFLLIRDLEDVEAYPMMSDGYIEFGFSPVVYALAQQSEDAVDPLLNCLERDQRLTRTIDRGGAMGIEANGPARIVGVEEPAFYALQAILKAQDQIPWLSEPYVNGTPGLGEHLDRVALAQRIRAYWNKVRSQPVEMRWVQMLKDDQATTAAWVEAATNLTRPANEGLGYGGVMVFYPTRGPLKPGERTPLAGDSLRGNTNPSIGDLIARRLHDSVGRLKTDSSPFSAYMPGKLAAALAAWDARDQLSTLKWWCDFLKNRLDEEKDSAGPGDMEDLTRTYLARIEAGDPTATSDYAGWIHSVDTHTAFALTQMYGAFYFAPVYSYPDDPVIKKLTQWLFEDADSPWSIGPMGVDPSWVAKCTHSGLVAVPAFRRLLLAQLENQKVVGNVEITKDNVMVNFVYGSGDLITDPETPPTGFKQDLRLCDIIANNLSRQAGFPRCEAYWPLEKRNTAIAQTIAFLEKYGDRVARKATSRELTLGDVPYAGPLHFDKLDHPATAAEAAEGRAIFSLEGQGERRLLSLPQIPQRANWMTLHDDPVIQTGGDGLGPVFQSKVFQQECEIWQAEEVLVGGKWRRYYGLVAPHKLAMVPGEEIEIIEPSAYDPIGNGWALRVDVGPQSETWEKRARFKRPAGDPVPITVWIRNMKGVEVPFPLYSGFMVTVLYTDQPYSFVSSWGASENVHWGTLPEKQPLKLVLQPHPNTLESLQSTELFQFNAADDFDLSKPGTYRIFVNIGSRNLSATGPQGSEEEFELTKGATR